MMGSRARTKQSVALPYVVLLLGCSDNAVGGNQIDLGMLDKIIRKRWIRKMIEKKRTLRQNAAQGIIQHCPRLDPQSKKKRKGWHRECCFPDVRGLYFDGSQ